LTRYKLVVGFAVLIAVLFFEQKPRRAENEGGSTSQSSVALGQEFQPSTLGAPLVFNGNDPNVVPISMQAGTANDPTVSVTLCQPGTNNCITVPNVRLDSGSTGLRIFASALVGANGQLLSLPTLNDAKGNPFGECSLYGGGSALWGSVATADVVMGNEKAAGLKLQVIDSTFASAAPADCTNHEGTAFTVAVKPDDLGGNGIFGVQPFALDCGANCPADSSGNIYYNCANNACTATAMPAEMQIPNPISKMAVDNNGFFIQFTNIAAGGSTFVSQAYLVMGIGTQANNKPPPGVRVLPVNEGGQFLTTFAGQALKDSFIDTGSWDYSFPAPTALNIPICNEPNGAPAMYCPPTDMSFTAQLGSGPAAINLGFSVTNGNNILTSSNTLYNDAADPGGGLGALGEPVSSVFDWGFPIFLGKTIYFGMDGVVVPGLGKGPFNAM
jgi:hypothetical protein